MTQKFQVFAFEHYRDLLREYYEVKKEQSPAFSYRVFSRLAGIRSPNHLKLVIDGSRRLTPSMARRFKKAMGLEGEESEFFLALVELNEGTSQLERDAAFRRLASIRGYRKAHRIGADQAAYHAHWYIPAIREMAVRSDFQPDPAWIAERIRPRIGRREAKAALELLFRLELLRREGKKVVLATPLVTTGEFTQNVHVPRFHRTMMDRASESIDLFEGSDRNLSAVTFCVGPDGIEKAKTMIREFRKDLLALAEREAPDASRVVHVGIQLFPLTTAKEDEKS